MAEHGLAGMASHLTVLQAQNPDPCLLPCLLFGPRQFWTLEGLMLRWAPLPTPTYLRNLANISRHDIYNKLVEDTNLFTPFTTSHLHTQWSVSLLLPWELNFNSCPLFSGSLNPALPWLLCLPP